MCSCGKAVGSNSIQCTNCQCWVQKRCSSVKGSLCRASKSFVCSVCLCSTDSEVKSCVDVVDCSSVEKWMSSVILGTCCLWM